MDANLLTDLKSEEHFIEWLYKPENLELRSWEEISQITQMLGENVDSYEPAVSSSMAIESIPCQLPPLPNLELEFKKFDDFYCLDHYFSPPQEAQQQFLQPVVVSDFDGNQSFGESWSENSTKTEIESVGSTTSPRVSVEDWAMKCCSRRSKSNEIELEEIKKHFNVPIVQAAKEMKVGLTVLKKRCRELNINRWPHRKIKSLASLIENIKELGFTEDLELLEDYKRRMEKVPEIELSENTKKLRQACFKAKYKQRKSSMAPILS